MNILNYLLMFLFAKNSIFCSTNTNLIQIINDVLLLQKDTVKVSFNLCWNVGDKISLVQHLNENRISYQSINNSFVNYNYELATRQVFLIDLRCPGYSNIFHEESTKMLFKLPYRWLIIVNDMNIIPEKSEILVDSQFYLIRKVTANTYSLKSIYKISKSDREFITNDIALWTSHNGFMYYNELEIVKNRSNLMGLDMNISYVITNLDSLNHLWDYRDKHIDGISKLNYLFSHYVTDYMNVTRNFIVTRTWGYKNLTTNLYDGLVGDLQSGSAELAGTAAFFTPDRISIIDYIAPTTPTRAKFIFRAPPLSYVTNVFTLPFDKMVWYASFLLIGIISIIVYTIVRWEWSDKEFRKILDQKQNAMRPNYMDVLVMQLGAICQQGSETEPKSASGRIATVFIFITLMFMYTSYSANIVALLQSTSESIKTLDDLLHSRIKLGVEDKPYSHYYFKTQTEVTRKAIYTQKVAPKGQTPNFMDIEIGIKKMREEFFAFHVECASGYKVVGDIFQESEKCGLREIDYLQMIDPWVAIRKNSSYKELAKVAFRKLHEHGLQNREFQKLYTKKPACQGQGSNFISVGLIDCYYAFLIFGIGAFISFLMLLMEVFIQRRCSKNILTTVLPYK